MTLYELAFILLFMCSVVVLIGILILAASGRRSTAWKTLLGTGTVWCMYFILLAVSDLMAKPLTVSPGQDRCFDEMCFAVASAQTSMLPASGDAERKLYIITVRVTNHSRGRTQGEGGLRARLYDHGRYYAVSTEAQTAYERAHGPSPRLPQRIAPGETINSVQVFDVPGSVVQPSLTLDHGFTPGYFIIGESPFFHEPDLLTLPRP